MSGCLNSNHDSAKDEFGDAVICSHPISQFEAQIDIVYGDEPSIVSIEFALEQYEEWWVIDLNPPNDDDLNWSHRMQIYEFTCSEPFYYDFIIETE